MTTPLKNTFSLCHQPLTGYKPQGGVWPHETLSLPQWNVNRIDLIQEKLFFMYGKRTHFLKLWDLLTSSSVCSVAYKYLEMYVQYSTLLAMLCRQVERLTQSQRRSRKFCMDFLIDLDLIVMKLRLHLAEEPALIAALAKQLLATPPSEGSARFRGLTEFAFLWASVSNLDS